jgi:hypothetical protein
MKIKKPSVSELLDLMAKPALIEWANKQGLLGVNIKDKRKRSLANGTSLHKQIEDYHTDGVLLDSEVNQRNLEAFIKGKRIIAMEQQIETEWFVGRYDVKLEHDGKEWLADYKSGFKGRVYLDYKLQLVAYAMAEPTANLAIVPIPQFHLIPVEIENREPYEQMLKTLSQLWQLKKEIERE